MGGDFTCKALWPYLGEINDFEISFVSTSYKQGLYDIDSPENIKK